MTTCNRKLEQFLYLHDIIFVSWRKNDDDMTEWTYKDTEELQRVVAEFKEIEQRRRMRKAQPT